MHKSKASRAFRRISDSVKQLAQPKGKGQQSALINPVPRGATSQRGRIKATYLSTCRTSPRSQRASSLPALPEGEPLVCVGLSRKRSRRLPLSAGAINPVPRGDKLERRGDRPSQSASELAASSPGGRAFGLCGPFAEAVKQLPHGGSLFDTAGLTKCLQLVHAIFRYPSDCQCILIGRKQPHESGKE